MSVEVAEIDDVADVADVVVAGGGIAGLAAAIALAANGHRVRVLERNAEFSELGAGIRLAPNAFAALRRLGVDAPVRASAVHVNALRLLDGLTGDELVRLDVDDDYRDRFGDTYAVAHRGDLHAALLSRCVDDPRVELTAGVAVSGYTQTPTSVVVDTTTGHRLVADALVAADGIRSVVRDQLLGDGPPRVSGHLIHRTLVPMAELPPRLREPDVCLWAGPGWHVVHYPIAGGTMMNLAITHDTGVVTPHAGLPVERAEVGARYRDLAQPARDLLDHGDRWRSWVLCDRDPDQRWSRGRVLLIGDAAHPMLQYAAQGACQALEDAVALGELTGGVGAAGFPAALAALVATRHERAARTQQVARRLGAEIYHAADEAAELRNAQLRAMSRADVLAAVGWLHGGGPAPAPRDLVAAGRGVPSAMVSAR